MKSQIESILFASVKPVSEKTLAKLCGVSQEQIRIFLNELSDEYNKPDHGVKLICVEEKNDKVYQLVTAPENFAYVKNFWKQEETGELTKPSLETLSIIAYLGPITKPELEKIRGVNCSLILRNLLIRDLVDFSEDKVSQEVYYNISLSFLRWLGLNNTSELPQFEEIRQDENLHKILQS